MNRLGDIEGPLIPLRKAMKEATKVRVAAAKLLDDLEAGDGEKALDDALREIKIIRAVYWGGSLTGRDCWRLMELREVIFSRLAEKLRR